MEILVLLAFAAAIIGGAHLMLRGDAGPRADAGDSGGGWAQDADTGPHGSTYDDGGDTGDGGGGDGGGG